MITQSPFVKYCIGISILWLSFSAGCALFSPVIKAIAPQGFYKTGN